jgi:hypothetical protein
MASSAWCGGGRRGYAVLPFSSTVREPVEGQTVAYRLRVSTLNPSALAELRHRSACSAEASLWRVETVMGFLVNVGDGHLPVLRALSLHIAGEKRTPCHRLGGRAATVLAAMFPGLRSRGRRFLPRTGIRWQLSACDSGAVATLRDNDNEIRAAALRFVDAPWRCSRARQRLRNDSLALCLLTEAKLGQGDPRAH